MSERVAATKLRRVALPAFAVALSAVFMSTTSACSRTSDSAAPAASAMPPEQMDHSKMKGMDGMGGMDAMHGKTMSMTGDSDYDFAANMRMHHQMAVDMSRAELENGKDPQLLQLAKDITAAQEQEIAVLGSWLDAHKRP